MEGPEHDLDDGGDATMLIHKGTEFEKAGKVPEPEANANEEWKCSSACSRKASSPIRRVDRDGQGHPRA